MPNLPIKNNDSSPQGKEKVLLPVIPVPQQDGILVVHKPKGPTSAACIGRIKRCLTQKKIGHAGTLDPMAEGVLLVLLGQATKISGYLMDEGEKVYSGSICLGVTTDTWDAEGQVVETRPIDGITEEDIRREMAALVGTYEQEVPAYSAAKHQGKPLYELARKGLEVPVKKKIITIFSGSVESVDLPHVRFRVRCSSGTYIRSLAHSLGIRLECGAMLAELVREYSHPFGLDAAHTVEEVAQSAEAFTASIASIASALPHWPKLTVCPEDVAKVKNGIALEYKAEAMANMPFMPDIRALFLEESGAPLALVQTATVGGKRVWTMLRGLWN